MIADLPLKLGEVLTRPVIERRKFGWSWRGGGHQKLRLAAERNSYVVKRKSITRMFLIYERKFCLNNLGEHRLYVQLNWI